MPGRDVRPLIRHLASGLGQPPVFPADAAWQWVVQVWRPKDARVTMRFMAWLWKTGTRDLEACQRMVQEVAARNIAEPYAYFSPNGDARCCRADSQAIEAAELENNRLKKEEREWLNA